LNGGVVEAGQERRGNSTDAREQQAALNAERRLSEVNAYR
jgi:hypothetical protein